MKYIIIIILALAVPAMALEPSTSERQNEKSKINVFQKNIHKKIKEEGYGTCDPERKLHLPPFN